jgi:hypothetical protein
MVDTPAIKPIHSGKADAFTGINIPVPLSSILKSDNMECAERSCLVRDEVVQEYRSIKKSRHVIAGLCAIGFRPELLFG